MEAARIWLEMEARGGKREEVQVEVELSKIEWESSYQAVRSSQRGGAMTHELRR